MRWRLLAILALVAAAVSATPSEAFQYESMSRVVGASVVATTAAYSSLTIMTCDGGSALTRTCRENFVSNKGTVDDMRYRLTETTTDPEAAAKVDTYGPEGTTPVATGPSAWSAMTDVGANAIFELHIPPCSVGCASTKLYDTYWTVEGQMAGKTDFTATRVKITIRYS